MEAAQAGGSIREPGKLYALAAYGVEGHAGVGHALTVHQDAYVTAREAARGEQADVASGDWLRQVQGAVGKKLAATGGAIAPSCDCGQGAAGEPDGVSSLFADETGTAGVQVGVQAEVQVGVQGLTLREQLLNLQQLRERPAAEPLIKGVLNLDSATWLIGAPGGFKSFVALDWACHIATGREWNGCRTRAGDVLYIVAEGVRGFAKRVDAWARKHGVQPERLTILPIPVQAMGMIRGQLSERWWELCELIGELQPALVVLDTQARMTVGMEENSNTEMGVWVAAVDAAKRAAGSCTLVVHHTGRNGGDARGASALDGAQDAEWRVDRQAHELACTLSMDKNKDGDDSLSWAFGMEVVTVGVDEDGDAVTSLVLALDSAAETRKSVLSAIRTTETEGGSLSLAGYIRKALEALAVPEDGLTRPEIRRAIHAWQRSAGVELTKEGTIVQAIKRGLSRGDFVRVSAARVGLPPGREEGENGG